MVIVQIFEMPKSVNSFSRRKMTEAIKGVFRRETTGKEIASVVFYDYCGESRLKKITIPILITTSLLRLHDSVDKADKEEIMKDIVDIITKKVYFIRKGKTINEIAERVEFAWVQSQ